jgi:hypothetical protein
LPHHIVAAPAPGLFLMSFRFRLELRLYTKSTFLKQAKVNIRVRSTFFSWFKLILNCKGKGINSYIGERRKEIKVGLCVHCNLLMN